jgi:hypothetical protein
MSLLELMMWNPAWDFINKRFWRPVSGPMLSKLVQFEEPLVTRCAVLRNLHRLPYASFLMVKAMFRHPLAA